MRKPENAAIPSGPEWDALLDELTRPAGRDDPYSRYAQLLREAPVVRAPDGAVVLTRYDDCHAALRDNALGHRDPDEVFGAFGFTDWREHPGVRLLQTSMLNLDPPRAHPPAPAGEPWLHRSPGRRAGGRRRSDRRRARRGSGGRGRLRGALRLPPAGARHR